MTNIKVFATTSSTVVSCAKTLNYEMEEWQSILEVKEISPVILDTKAEHSFFIQKVLGKDTPMHRFSLTVVWKKEERAK